MLCFLTPYTIIFLIKRRIVNAICIGRTGDLKLLKWFRKHGYPWDENTCTLAAMGGHLHVLKWARKMGCKWNSNTLLKASVGRHLHVYNWAIQNGCPDTKQISDIIDPFKRYIWPFPECYHLDKNQHHQDINILMQS